MAGAFPEIAFGIALRTPKIGRVQRGPVQVVNNVEAMCRQYAGHYGIKNGGNYPPLYTNAYVIYPECNAKS